MNIRDSEVITGILQQSGFEVVASEDDADVVIYNTCAVREHAEAKVWSEIGSIAKRRRNPLTSLMASNEARGGTGKIDNHLFPRTQNPKPRTADNRFPIIGLVGCMAKNYGQAAFARSPFVDFVVGPQDIAKIPEILQKLVHSPWSTDYSKYTKDERRRAKDQGSILFERKIWETDGLVRPEEIYHSGFRSDTKKAYIVISEGCSNYCSYCVVPYVRGPLRHRRQEDILQEAQEAASKGITEIFLLGQNVNSYRSASANGAEGDFVDLLEAVHALEGVNRISFISSHPKDSNTRLFKAIAGLEKVKKSLHLPFQSGSDRILKLMNRGYNNKYYLELAREYRKIVPGGELSTDIIVGFPGESEEDFQATYRMVEDVRFNSAFIFKYSPRPHSKAAEFSDDVPKIEKERRHKLILDLQKRISLSGKQRREAK